VLQSELKEYPDDLPTSFVDAETQIAQHICKCLADVPEQRRDISGVQALLRVYKVVRLLPGGNHSVSLERVYSILQDNYIDSSLHKLFYLMLTGVGKAETKVITFF
jgi:hypothetical protein